MTEQRWLRVLTATVAFLGASALAAAAGSMAGRSVDVSSTSDRGSGGECAVSAAAAIEQTPGVNLPAIIAAVRPSVVAIEVSSTTFDANGAPVIGTITGTGFAIDGDGMVATNAHVVAGGGRITVTLPDGRVVESTTVGIDEGRDLAVIDTDTQLRPVTFGCSGDLVPGQTVVAIGNALALGGEPTASVGIIAALDREITTKDGQTYSTMLQSDLAMNEGQSGGPLVDEHGAVVGVSTAALVGGSHVAFAIGIDEALPILERLSVQTQ